MLKSSHSFVTVHRHWADFGKHAPKPAQKDLILMRCRYGLYHKKYSKQQAQTHVGCVSSSPVPRCCNSAHRIVHIVRENKLHLVEGIITNDCATIAVPVISAPERDRRRPGSEGIGRWTFRFWLHYKSSGGSVKSDHNQACSTRERCELEHKRSHKANEHRGKCYRTLLFVTVKSF